MFLLLLISFRLHCFPFLSVDSQLNAKIADLDLGHQYSSADNNNNNNKNVAGGGGNTATEGSSAKQKKNNNNNNDNGAVRVGGSNMCIYWQAPEVCWCEV